MFTFLLTLVFTRPFISSHGFVYLNSFYSLVFVGFLILWGATKGISFEKIRTLKYPLILLLLALAISLAFSINKLNSLKELYKYIGGLLIFLIAASLTYKDKMQIVWIIVIGGFIISLLDIYQYLFGFRHLLEYITKHGISDLYISDRINQKRPFIPFVTPNALGGYLIMIIPLILVLWGQKKKVFGSLFLIFALVSVSVAFILAKSLGALLSIFLASGAYLSLRGRLEKKWLISLFALLLTIGLVFIARVNIYEPKIFWWHPFFSALTRLNWWEDALKIIQTGPLTGVGIGNFNLAESRYAHNSYLQIWAEMGILGIISIIWLVFAVFKSAFANIKKSQFSGLFISCAAFLTHNLIDFTLFLPEVNFTWWIILGLLAGKGLIIKEENFA